MEKTMESDTNETTFIRTPKDNRNYILIGSIGELLLLPLAGAPENVLDDWENLFEEATKFEVENRRSATGYGIVVKKDSLLGKYLVSLFGSLIINLDDYISHREIVNAMNVAIFESNPISEKLIVLFKNQVSGEATDLEQKYGVEVVKYIKENKDFDFYLDQVNGEYNPKEYLVYENGQLSKKIIAEVQKQKVIDNK